jgi:outer membrane autotransporter protein
VGGFDNQLADNLLLGIAGSYTKATVTQEDSSSTITRIKNYQVMLYGSFRSASYAYLDGVFSVGTNNYQGTRVMNITSFNAVADSRYSGQQLTLKLLASKNYRLLRYYQLTPMGSAQYSFLRQLPYQETNAGPFNRVVQPNNINLLQLGAGAQFSCPFDEGQITGVPAIYAMLLVDAQGGALVTNSAFISGGPIINNVVQPGRLIARAGMSMNFKVSDSVEIVGNYNVDWRRKYICNELFLNLRYIF